MRLEGKHIVLGVTGSIAAYKAAILVRLLKKEGCEVQVLMTPTAREFIAPLTMATLSSRPILVDFFDPENGAWNSHVSLGIWADALVIAPATANTLCKMSAGIADNLLLTTYLSARSEVFAAPAMDEDMYRHTAVQTALETLASRGVHMVEPGTGFLASGLEGKGRMAEPEEIVEALVQRLVPSDLPLQGRHFLVTAGPTYEQIDPVRYIGNHSSGKMGFAVAETLAARGAHVTLVTGPTSCTARHPQITCVPVVSAAEMLQACLDVFPQTDGAVMAAAVADYRPAQTSDRKIKKSAETLSLTLCPTEDIAARLGALKTEKQVLAGFALETDDEEAHALDKMQRKHFDFIVLNSLRDEGAGFRGDTNKITILSPDGDVARFPLESKQRAAGRIADRICALL